MSRPGQLGPAPPSAHAAASSQAGRQQRDDWAVSWMTASDPIHHTPHSSCTQLTAGEVVNWRLAAIFNTILNLSPFCIGKGTVALNIVISVPCHEHWSVWDNLSGTECGDITHT